MRHLFALTVSLTVVAVAPDAAEACSCAFCPDAFCALASERPDMALGVVVDLTGDDGRLRIEVTEVYPTGPSPSVAEGDVVEAGDAGLLAVGDPVVVAIAGVGASEVFEIQDGRIRCSWLAGSGTGVSLDDLVAANQSDDCVKHLTDRGYQEPPCTACDEGCRAAGRDAGGLGAVAIAIALALVGRNFRKIGQVRRPADL